MSNNYHNTKQKNTKAQRAKARKKEIKVPSILAFTRKIEPTDGLFYGTDWQNRHTRQAEPLHLQQKRSRFTDSNADMRFDVCLLPDDCGTLLLDYGVYFLAGVEEPWECTDPDFEEAYSKLIDNYKSEYGFHELASRYAQNIANARVLGRNRIGAQEIEVIVNAKDKTWTFNAYDFSIRNFDHAAEVSELADMIENALSGKIPHLLVNVKTYAAKRMDKMEVYPSEEKRSFNKQTGEKSKILYATGDIAAFRSRKIGNAIRTIDTWYPSYGEKKGVGPIAAEVYGTTRNPIQVFRAGDGSDFYSIFDNAVANGSFQNAEEAHYAVAVLMRGGNFGTKQMS